MLDYPELIYDYILCIAAGCLFALYRPRRKRFGLRLGVGAGLALACVALVVYLTRLVPEGSLLSYLRFASILSVALAAAVVYGGWEVSPGRLLFCAACGCALQNMGSNLRTLVAEYVTSDRIVRELVPMFIVFVAGYYLWIRRTKKATAEPSVQTGVVGLISALFVCIILPSRMYKFDLETTAMGVRQIVNFQSLFLCILIIETQLDAVENRSILKDNQHLTLMLQEREDKFRDAQVTMEQINNKCHDLKHYLISHPDQGPLDAEMKEDIQAALTSVEAQFHTGCEPLDLVLWEKSRLFSKYGILFECMSDGSVLSGMRAIDVYAIFENVLQNAIEASEQCDPDERVISMTVCGKNRFALIHVENHYVTPVELRDGLPVTSKQNREEHGFGVASVRMLAQKYNGMMSVSVEDDLFNLDIAIPLEKSA